MLEYKNILFLTGAGIALSSLFLYNKFYKNINNDEEIEIVSVLYDDLENKNNSNSTDNISTENNENNDNINKIEGLLNMTGYFGYFG